MEIFYTKVKIFIVTNGQINVFWWIKLLIQVQVVFYSVQLC